MCVRLQAPREDDRENDAVETVLMIYNTPNHLVLRATTRASLCEFDFANVNLLRWIINDRGICSSGEQSVWCRTAGSINMHKEFTVTFAEASQYEMKKERQGKASQWGLLLKWKTDSFIFSPPSHLHSCSIIMNPLSILSYFHALTQLVRSYFLKTSNIISSCSQYKPPCLKNLLEIRVSIFK